MNSLEVNCFPDAGLRPSPLHHVSSASQTGTLMWPCYSKFFLTSGDLASSGSPGQLCPLVNPHNLTLQLPLDVDSLPNLGPNSTFDELPKDTTSALVSSFNFPVSVLVARWVWPPHMIQDEPIALVFSGDVITLFLFLPVGKMKLCGTRSPQSLSVWEWKQGHIYSYDHHERCCPSGLLLLPSASLRPQKLSHFCFYMGSDDFFFLSSLEDFPAFSWWCLWLGTSVIISFVRMAIPGQCQGHCHMSQRHLTLHFLQSFPCPS